MAHSQPNERVYHLTGYDLAVRLNAESHQQRIETLDEHIKQFRFIWDGMPLQPQVGMSYCYVRSPVNHLYLVLGELGVIADLSLSTNHPENLQQRGAVHLQRSLKDKIAMMSRLQKALDNNEFTLLAQPVRGLRGDRYHEVLLRMPDADGVLLTPDRSCPSLRSLACRRGSICGCWSARCVSWPNTVTGCPASALPLILRPQPFVGCSSRWR
ncbi:diguanylate cyclase/phosphodiesterase [Enterobacter cloacae]|uniref:Diguanylate cyclase/phosphodiesterase n=1 Tax=Enterobacter cloacae TaxID=550 RepID=A0A377LWR9_ENTCL|nr:diguanylate cyclase/phosphodiesterase [Enterobacter cloacae]